ncbi:hypothetical protein N9S81_00285 [bacterium]|nr:hypothetical protein [bacterium]
MTKNARQTRTNPATATAQSKTFRDNALSETRTKIVKYRGKSKFKVVSKVLNGKLVGGCYNNSCNKACVDMAEFMPRESNNTSRKRVWFSTALDSYYAAYNAGEHDEAATQRTLVETYRSGKCPACLNPLGYLSPKIRACKNFYDDTRKAVAAAQGGCLYPNCCERGLEAWCVLEGDHIHGSKHPDPALRKVHQLSDYTWWSWNGGVPAMRKEVAKGIEWKCRFCHWTDPMSDQANKYSDPETMPKGNRRKNATPREIQQYHNRWYATIVYPKQNFVDAHKRNVRTCCLRCARPVVAGEEHCFIFDHRVPSTKMVGAHTLAGEHGGVAGLVHNDSKSHATLEIIQPILEREMGLCDLLCVNCDRRKTAKYPERADVVAARAARAARAAPIAD